MNSQVPLHRLLELGENSAVFQAFKPMLPGYYLAFCRDDGQVFLSKTNRSQGQLVLRNLQAETGDGKIV